MSELQSTVEFSIELFKFYNVDLFQRGMYQVRCSLRVCSKMSIEIEVTTPEVTTGLGSAIVLGNYGACRPFQILYRNEEVILKDVVLFRCHLLVDGSNLRESLDRAEFSLLVELWFGESPAADSMALASSRTLRLHVSPAAGLHHHLPVLFDYFHLAAVSLTVHAALTALHQPSIRKGLLRYMQSCAPKSSKSWSKTKPANAVLSMSRYNSRLNESQRVHSEAYNVLMDSSNNLKSTIRHYKKLMQEREESVSENYDTLIVKHNDYDSTKLMKKRPHKQNSELADVCAENIKLWNYFLLTFSCKIAIQQYLSRKHHDLRVRRFAELFFLIYNPRKTAYGCFDTNYQNYLVIAEVARRSKYMQMLPPLPIHCIALDGECATMPVIFEDHYQDPFDFTRENPVKDNDSKSIRNIDSDSWVTPSKSLDLEETCSCGMGSLWETRRRTTDTLFADEPTFAVLSRHCKSLDQLRIPTKTSLGHVREGRNREPACSWSMKRAGKSANDGGALEQKYQTMVVKSSGAIGSDGCRDFLRPKSEQGFVVARKNRVNGHGETMLRKEARKSAGSTTNGKHWETTSPSTSTESISLENPPAGTSAGYPPDRGNPRRSRSTPCLAPDRRRSAGSVRRRSAGSVRRRSAESLPNIVAEFEEGPYPELEFYGSASSAASGWMSSESSSVASSSDVINPPAAILNEVIRKKLYSNSVGKRSKSKKARSENDKSKKLIVDSDSSNNGTSTLYQKQLGFPSSIKGCESNQNSAYEVFALPPPKQFRDLEVEGSPSSSATNGTVNEEEEDEGDEDINAVDNLLYHVVDTRTNLERSPRVQNPRGRTEDASSRKDHPDVLETFIKAKKEYKRQLNFPGLLYSDLDRFASTVPYFHIGDEFRIFSPEGLHLVVCVHGLDGNSADLRLVKTYLELGLPGAYLDFLMSETNQGDTFSDFETMTDRLISEILHYLDVSSIRPTRISFVGHSLGNIIIRSALTRPQMKFLLPRLHTFLSLSGPHLGTLYNSSGLVNMGMWFMQKWKKSGSLLQLCMKDSLDPRQSFLYRLSQRSTLHHFKNILLCGSSQDRYVPLHSARIELCRDSLKDTSDQGGVYRDMVRNILAPIVAQKQLKLLRYDVHHALPNTANALIGRAAHIAVLDSELFIEKFMVVVGIKYFR